MAVFAECVFSGSDFIMDFFSCIVSGLSTSAGSLWGIGIVLLIGIVSFIGAKDYSFDRAMGVSGFITLIAGFFLLKLQWINVKVFLLLVVWFVIGMYYLIKERGGEEA